MTIVSEEVFCCIFSHDAYTRERRLTKTSLTQPCLMASIDTMECLGYFFPGGLVKLAILKLVKMNWLYTTSRGVLFK